MDGSRLVIAVRSVEHISLRSATGADGLICITIAIGVGIPIKYEGGKLLICLAIAVIIHAITDFCSARMDRGLGVCTVSREH